MKKYLLIIMMVSFLFGANHKSYVVVDVPNNDKRPHSFANMKVLEIRTFDAIEFSDGRVENKSKDNLKAIIGTIKSYIENGKNIRIKVIGYTRTQTDRHKNLKEDSSSDSYNVKHDFRFVEPEDEAEESSTIYASYIVGELEKNKISKNLITKEFHNSKTIGNTSIKEKGLTLPNRVIITMYVVKRKTKKKIEKAVAPAVVVEKKVEKEIIPAVVVEKKVEKEIIPAVVVEKKVEKEIVPVVIVEKKVEKEIVPVVVIEKQVEKAVVPAVVVEKQVEKAVAPTVVVEKQVVIDSDKDGVDDSVDKCLDTRSYVKVGVNGCALDSDKDGVSDHKDVCSNTPYGAKVYENGCPIRKK